MTDRTKEAALLKVLQAAGINNEDGDQIVDFKNQDRDGADFGSVSRSTLHRMLAAAYDAGRYAR